MLYVDLHEDFIAIGAKEEIFKYATAIMPIMGYDVFKSGYDVDDFIKHVAESAYLNEILDKFTFDSEYCMFCMYYKHPKGKITDEHIQECIDYVSIINHAIRNQYMQVIANLDTNVEIHDIRKNKN
jgi:hypothetical protein